MFDSVPNKISEEIRVKIKDYANDLLNGKEPVHNLLFMQKQYTALVAMGFRKKLTVGTSKRLAKNLVSKLFEDIIEEINSEKN